jgi:hypothetical protein
MYLTRAQRVLCWLASIPLLFFVAVIGVEMFEGPARDKAGKTVALVILLLLASCPVWPLLAYYFSGAWRRRLQPDFLKENLQLSSVAELRGVQWTLLAFPDRLGGPGVVVVALILQNAHGTPRVVTASLLNNPFQRGGGRSIRQTLEGGEVGLLRFPLLVPQAAPPARHELRFSIEVRRAGRVGARVIRRDGLPPRRLIHSRRAEIEVLGGHSGSTSNEAALGWPAFQRIYITGQGAPDLEPVRLLESL